MLRHTVAGFTLGRASISRRRILHFADGGDVRGDDHGNEFCLIIRFLLEYAGEADVVLAEGLRDLRQHARLISGGDAEIKA